MILVIGLRARNVDVRGGLARVLETGVVLWLPSLKSRNMQKWAAAEESRGNQLIGCLRKSQTRVHLVRLSLASLDD